MLTLCQGLFSVSNAPFMENAGDAAFAVLMTLSILITYTIALFMQKFIDKWPTNPVWKRRTKGTLVQGFP